MNRLYIDYSSHSSGGEVEDPEDRWSQHTPEHIELRVKKIARTQSGFFGESLEVDDETYNQKYVYLVVKRYQDGNSFGTQYGCYSFECICKTIEEAEEYEKVIRDKYKTPRYFTCLEDVEIHHMRVES